MGTLHYGEYGFVLSSKDELQDWGHGSSKHWGLLFRNVTLLRWENQRESSIDLVLLR